MTEHGSFFGKVALVTGAGGGIGSAVARLLADLGARVAITDRNDIKLAQVLGSLLDAGCAHHIAVPADITSRPAVERTVEEVEEAMGTIDFLVNVAGILHHGPILEMCDEDWESTFASNVRGVFFFSRSVAQRMAEKASGAIVTVTSNATFVPRVGMAAYAASKAAASMFTKCLGLEMANYGVRCNVVAPGSTDTPMLHSLWTGADGRETTIRGDLNAFRVGIPLARIATPLDIARSVTFLLSDHASHITMQELCVDGGASLGN